MRLTTADLKPYQKVAVAFLKGRPTSALFLDMGLGKTACVLNALEPRHLPALVVAPKRVCEHVWPAEINKWRHDLSLSMAVGGPSERKAALRTPADITVISRDNIGDLNDLKGRGAWPWRTIVIDELSGFKSQGTRWKIMARHRWGRPRLEYVWGLTGTPAPNGYLGLWSQIALLDKGKRLGEVFTAFRNRYFYITGVTRDGVITGYDPFPETIPWVKNQLQDICLSMSAAEYLDLPDITINEVAVDLPPAAMKAYRKMERELAVNLIEFFGEGATHSAKNAAALTQKLTQITAGFMYPNDRDIFPDEPASILHTKKADALQEIIDGVGEPLLVGYAYREELAALQARFPWASHIDDPGAIERWNEGTVRMMLAHPASAGHGLNLQYGGHHLVWTSLTWDLELWLQFIGRLHRTGQENAVIVHVLLATGTIDYLQLQRARDKDDRQIDLLDFFASLV